MTDGFFRTIKIDSSNKTGIRCFSERSGVPYEMLRYYNDTNTLPSGENLEKICIAAEVEVLDLELGMGQLSRHLLDRIAENVNVIKRTLVDRESGKHSSRVPSGRMDATFTTARGALYHADCLEVMAGMRSDSVDVVFADPPFNLKKLYPSEINDDLKESQYLSWSEKWMGECIRILKPGGSFFLWNLPRWNAELSGFLSGRLTFRHWISVDLKYSLPIAGRLYPSHYGLLYYCKGPKPRVFHPDRLPMEVCPQCASDLRDYGGYKNKMNPAGVNLMDVWYDITPVRHSKYKKRRGANELSVRLLDRIIQMSSDPGDLVFDPFGGSGTTFAVAELKERRWVGSEIGPTEDIARRLSDLSGEREYLKRIRRDLNSLFTDEVRDERERIGLWTDETAGKGRRPRETQAQLELREKKGRKYNETSS